jgi:hypothetical protein
MMNLPSVLGLAPEQATQRLIASGFTGVEVHISGRRREGKPKVIRLKLINDKPELTVSYFKELDEGM